jgi:hypothetical protein
MYTVSYITNVLPLKVATVKSILMNILCISFVVRFIHVLNTDF